MYSLVESQRKRTILVATEIRLKKKEGIIRSDRVRNVAVTGQLNMFIPVHTFLNERRLGWLQYIQTMGKSRITRKGL